MAGGTDFHANGLIRPSGAVGFDPAATFAFGGPVSATTGDFDWDADPDLATANQGGEGEIS